MALQRLFYRLLLPFPVGRMLASFPSRFFSIHILNFSKTSVGVSSFLLSVFFFFVFHNARPINCY